MIANAPLLRSQGYRNFATLLHAGVPVIEALESIAAGLRAREREDLAKIVKLIQGGLPLHQAMSIRLPVLDCSLLKVGETNGNLTEILNYLSNYYEERHTLQKAVRSAFFKPGFLLFSSLCLGSLPQLVSGEFSAKVYLIKTAIPILILATFALILIQFVKKTDGAFLLPLPWIGKKVENFSLERFFLSLALSFKSGCSLDTALHLASHIVANPRLIRAAQQTRARQGKMGFANALATTQIIRERHLAELRTGEFAGTLDTAFERIRQEMRRENLATIEQFVAWTPRVIYFFAVLYVGWGIVSSFKSIMEKTMKEIPM